ncbi:META domain-containing protein [Glutamicibacter sp.]|uniref:META domain-containing protein n=1 Tax=Glutamicibacter sp. TaxID=1931995 RepID=UPI0028BF0B63|nr:META domain-containing protein [Glutamicibacter sp.]
MKRLFALLVLSAAALSLSACGPSDEPADQTSAPAPVDPGGAWGSHEQGQPWLDLGDDGTLTGNDGCNRLSGQWKDSDTGIDFGAMASTKMYCEGVDTWLSGAATATVAQDVMTLKDSQGEVIGTLQRTQSAGD